MSNTISKDEQRRIKQVIGFMKNGDYQSSAAEYAYFVRTYSLQVLDFTSRMVPERSDAEELAQDAFVKAFRSMPTFRFQSSFLTWVSRIAYHESLNHLKRKRAYWVNIDDVNLPDDEGLDAELSTCREERIQLMEEAIDELPPDERMLIHLYYYQDKPLREIAFIMDTKPKALATRLHRIRKKLLFTINNRENETSRR